MSRYSLFAALALCAGVASAQTSLELTYTPSGGTAQTCVYTTDGNNLSLKPSGALGANGTFGANCPSGSTGNPPVIGNPSFVNGLAGDVMPAVTTGGTAALSWQADADSCSYDGSTFPSGVSFGATWPVSGVACSSAATCNALHSANLVLPKDGAYKFRLTCSKTGNAQTVSSEVNTTATTPTNPTACTGPGGGITRQTIGAVCEQNNVDDCTDGQDLTRFESVFGGGTKPFPQTKDLPKRIMINKNQFVSLKFTVPADFSPKGYGSFVGSEVNLGGDPPYISMTISPTCGDFAVANPISPYCLLNQGGGGVGFMWSTLPPGSYDYDHTCHLTQGQSYYLNIIYAPLARPDQSTCPGSTCNRTIKNDVGDW